MIGSTGLRRGWPSRRTVPRRTSPLASKRRRPSPASSGTSAAELPPRRHGPTVERPAGVHRFVRGRVMEGVARLLAAGDDLAFAKVAAEAAVPERTVDDEVADLDPATGRRLAAALQLMTTAGTWQTPALDHWGMDGDEAAETAALGHRPPRARRPQPPGAAHQSTNREGAPRVTHRRHRPRRRPHRGPRPLRRVLHVRVRGGGRLHRDDAGLPPRHRPHGRPRGCTRPKWSATGTAAPRRPCSSAATSTTSRWPPRRPRRSRPFARGS